MKRFYFFLFVALVCGSAMAQTEEPAQLKHYLGFDAGFSNGYGLSYRYMPKKWGVQVNAFPYVSENEHDISVGATLIRTVYRNRHMQFFLYYGNHLRFEKYPNAYYYNNNGSYTPANDYNKTTTWITGIGPGFEVYIAKRLALNARFGFAYYNKGYNGEWMINGDAGIGLHYMF
jgi:hypothetical protein